MRSCSSLKISDDVMTERCTRKLPPSTSSITSSDRSIGQPFAVRARAYRGAGASTNAKLLPIDNQAYHRAEALYLPATCPEERARLTRVPLGAPPQDEVCGFKLNPPDPVGFMESIDWGGINPVCALTNAEDRRMPQKYRKSEAKDWARQNWHGLCNVIIPSYSSDLKRLNETGIRHDVRRNIELGFWGALLVSEAATTDDEYIEFMEIAVDEAKGKHNFLFHGCFDTAEDVVRLAKDAERHRPRRRAARPSAVVLSAEREGALRLHRIRLQPHQSRRRRLCPAALEFSTAASERLSRRR